jgi:geranylgeranyl pyrophosphate synthase
MTEAEYLRIVSRKSATLFDLPCRLGAMLGGVSGSAATALSSFGAEVGTAFQLAEDVRALRGEGTPLGEATRSDLRPGLSGLPIIKGLHDPENGARLHELLVRVPMSASQVQEATALLEANGSVQATLDVAWEHARRAQRALVGLPDSPSVRSLMRLAEYAVTRRTGALGS